MDNLYENGIYTILATPTGARPVWDGHEISGEKPVPGVERHVRYSKEYAYIFYLNDSDAAITLNNLDGIDLVTGGAVYDRDGHFDSRRQ